MKKLISVVIIFLTATTNVFASNIVALVNDQPITMYEFQSRKKMIMALNNIHNPDANTDNQLSKVALNALIDEQLLSQHTVKVGGKISEEEVSEAIKTIEQKNNMPGGYLSKMLRGHGVEESFRSQIKSELIKMNILSHISRSVSVSSKEIDTAILSTNSKDARISIEVFTSKDKDDKTLQKMYNLRKSLKNCSSMKESLYNKFASVVKIDKKLSSLDRVLQSIINDLKVNQSSTVFEMADGFKLILLCSKEIEGVSSEENNYVTNFLTNKKTSQKSQKFFKDLRKKAYIKIM